MEEGCILFCMCNSLVLNKGLLYMSTTPKGEMEGVLAFLVPSSQCNKPPSIKNIFVIMDHFTHYALAVVTKDQTAKTIGKVLYERFIAVFGMPAKLLSDRGANFTSVLVEELCTVFGMQKCQTTVYHPQCNGQVKHFHQMLFQMIGKPQTRRRSGSNTCFRHITVQDQP